MLSNNKLMDKFLVPILVSTVLSLKQVSRIETLDDGVNVIFRIFIIASIVFMIMKYGPKVFNHLVNK